MLHYPELNPNLYIVRNLGKRGKKTHKQAEKNIRAMNVAL